MKLDLYEIAEVLSAKNDVTQFENVALRNAEFDSRLIESGDLLCPQGARDAGDFIATAFAQGAVTPYLSVQWQRVRIFSWRCPNAFAWPNIIWKKMQVDVLAVTGSNGKTTTRHAGSATSNQLQDL